MKIWQIKRTDKKERCCRCLKPLKGNKWKDPEFKGYRFEYVGVCCRKLKVINSDK